MDTTQLQWERAWKKLQLSRASYMTGVTSRVNPVMNNLRRILNLLSRSVIVEGGCGDGYVIRSIGKDLCGSFLIGIDYSKEAIKFAKTSCASLNVAFILGDVRHLPLRVSSVDIVTSFGVIEHFGNNGQSQIVCEGFRILKPGGFLFVESPNRVAFGLSENMANSLSNYYGNHSFYTPAELLQLVINALSVRGEAIESVLLCRAAGFAHAVHWSVTNQSRECSSYLAIFAAALFVIGLTGSAFFSRHGLFSQVIVKKAKVSDPSEYSHNA